MVVKLGAAALKCA